MRRAAMALFLLVCLSSPDLADTPEKVQGLFPLDPSGKVFFQEVVTTEGVSAGDLYSQAKAWAALAYRSAKDVIQLDDREGGRLVLKGSIQDAIGGTGTFFVRHTFAIEVKDGKYRYTVDGFQWAPAGGSEQPLESFLNKSGDPRMFYRAPLERVHAKLLLLIEGLKAAMTKPADKW